MSAYKSQSCGEMEIKILGLKNGFHRVAKSYTCMFNTDVLRYDLQSNFNGSNIFGTMEICLRYG